MDKIIETNKLELEEKIDQENLEIHNVKSKSEILNEWIDKSNFDETNSVAISDITDSLSSENFEDGCSSITNESEDLDEYMKNMNIGIKSKEIQPKDTIIESATQFLGNHFNSNKNETCHNHGNISIGNSKNVHIGNVTYISGNVKIVQNLSENYETKSKNNESIEETENQGETKIEITASSSLNSVNYTKDYLIGHIEQPVLRTKIMIIQRRTWLAQSPMEECSRFTKPVPFVIIAHTATEITYTQAETTYMVRQIQNYHIESMNYSDISYNFLIGGDGNVYEGRGWDVIGSHTFGFNEKAICIAFVGCFMKELPPKASLNVAQLLIKLGVKLNKIDPNYKLVGHCQCRPTQSPGKKLFEEIQTWSNYSSCIDE